MWAPHTSCPDPHISRWDWHLFIRRFFLKERVDWGRPGIDSELMAHFLKAGSSL